MFVEAWLSSWGVVYHIWKVHFNFLVTTADQLGKHRPVRRTSRREFWRPRPAPDTGAGGAWIRVFRRAMACRVEVLLPASAEADVAAARAALDEADRIEAAWSVFRDDSDLVRLNRQAGSGPCAVDPELHALLARCAQLSADTGGAFDITATPLSRCWGLLARAGVPPGPEALSDARARVGMRHVRLTAPLPGSPATVSFAVPGVELNLGAIGKGYAVGRMAARLGALGVGQALVSAGDSSIEAVGAPPGGWPLALRGAAAGTMLRLTRGAVATSGAAEQGLDAGGRRLAHVLDPRTGQPVHGVTRVTVVAPDAADADALATAFLVGGPELAERYVAAHDDILAIFALEGAAAPSIIGRSPGAVVEAA